MYPDAIFYAAFDSVQKKPGFSIIHGQLLLASSSLGVSSQYTG